MGVDGDSENADEHSRDQVLGEERRNIDITDQR